MEKTPPAPLDDSTVDEMVRKYRRFDSVNAVTPDQARDLLADLRRIFPDWLHHRKASSQSGRKPAPAALAPKAAEASAPSESK